MDACTIQNHKASVKFWKSVTSSALRSVITYLVSSGKWLLSGSIDTQLIVAGTHIHECYSVYKHLISAAAGGSESNSTFPALSVSSHV